MLSDRYAQLRRKPVILSTPMKGRVLDPARTFDQAHLLDIATWHIERSGTSKHDGQRLRPQDRHI
jgi:hypothetical protein